MDDQERKDKTLRAEEAIQQLDIETKHYSKSAEQVEEARHKLEEAIAAIKEAKEKISEASGVLVDSGGKLQETVTSASKEGVKNLTEAAQQIGKIEKQIIAATDTFQEVAQTLEGNSQNQLSRLDELVKAQAEQAFKSDSQLSQLTTRIRWALILAALAFVSAGAGVVLLLIKTG